MQSCDQMIMALEFEGSSFKVNDVFTTTNTDDGYCCSMNTIIQKKQKL